MSDHFYFNSGTVRYVPLTEFTTAATCCHSLRFLSGVNRFSQEPTLARPQLRLPSVNTGQRTIGASWARLGVKKANSYGQMAWNRLCGLTYLFKCKCTGWGWGGVTERAIEKAVKTDHLVFSSQATSSHEAGADHTNMILLRLSHTQIVKYIKELQIIIIRQYSFLKHPKRNANSMWPCFRL